MYNQQLEELIDAALADGVLTEKEKEILFRRAEAFGIDRDEFEMVLDARVSKLKAIAPKSNKMGDVKKCPACGATVSADMVSCPECGYAFSDISANQSSQQLAEKLRECSTWEREQIITTFPVPNAKADLLEFLTSMIPRCFAKEKGYGGDISNAYRQKVEECINKANVSFPNDPQFQGLIARYEKMKKEDLCKKVIFRVLFAAVIVLALWFLIWLFSPKVNRNASKCNAAVTTAIQRGKYDKAETLIRQYKGSYDIESAKQALFDTYVSVGSADKARSLLKSYISDINPSSLMEKYMNAGQIDQALNLANDTAVEYLGCASSLVSALIKEKRYDSAEALALKQYGFYYKKDIDGMLDFYCKVIDDICTTQGAAAARKYAKEKSLKFHYSQDEEYNVQVMASKRFEATIAKYQ